MPARAWSPSAIGRRATGESQREHLTLPPDVANGMVPMLLKNVRPGAAPQTLSLVVATPKPRL